LGNTYHLSIGQGDILTTPLQVNAWTATIANGGKLCQPHLRKCQMSYVKCQNYNLNVQSEDKFCKELGLKPETLSLIQEGMKRACAPGGTGWPLFKFKVPGSRFAEEIPVACKTGTSEYGDPKGRTHAWITTYAPADDPEIVVTILVEGGGEGSSVAGPIAKKVLEEWFGR